MKPTLLPPRWRTNLRGNLDLWPTVSPNISALATFDGKPYDENAMTAALQAANDPRAVRNTFEVLALTGLAYKDDANPSNFRLTDLGRCAFSFLGVVGGKRFANEANKRLLAALFIRALSSINEITIIWELMRLTSNRLSNEELNRAMPNIQTRDDIAPTAQRILDSRATGDPKPIGPRLYEDAKYGTPQQSDQRKAMNPLFLMSGGGRLFMTLDATDEYRQFHDWAVPLIDDQLVTPRLLMHAETDGDVVLAMSDYAAVPKMLEF